MVLQQALEFARRCFEKNTESPREDAEVLLCKVLHKNRAYLYAYPESVLTPKEQTSFEQLVLQRQKGIPIAYLLHEKEFWSLPLTVSSDTLIPRPETELLVELSLNHLPQKKQIQVLDLGTGSGAVALALAHERPDWHLHAVDVSLAALQVAKYNATKLNIKNIVFYQSNWFDELDKSLVFDAILSNPPYIDAQDPHLLQGDVRFEPRSALVADDNGLQALAYIIHNALARLHPGGLLLLEHGYNQQAQILSMLKDHGYTNLLLAKDFAGHDRISGGKRP